MTDAPKTNSIHRTNCRTVDLYHPVKVLELRSRPQTVGQKGTKKRLRLPTGGAKGLVRLHDQ